MTFPFFKGISQTNDQSKGVYNAIYITNTWGKLDKNKDNKFSKNENERTWNRYKYLDTNNNNEVFPEEFSKIKIPYLDNGGVRKLNVLYKETKEENLYLDIYYPKNRKEGQKLPVVIYTHGGGWAAGSRHGASNASFKTVHMDLLEKGFCVVSVSYRL
ncbi:carboxylesterase family protein [uncultured Polaribacter sp.]|uniref:carboxylesterase family protein n=1 Tax=uncultured Polaribacter sp. TaxID=174711 RepID=UPI002602A6CF|nr:carboxylesterase family protein [uncultured Polaribacter sp.]